MLRNAQVRPTPFARAQVFHEKTRTASGFCLIAASRANLDSGDSRLRGRTATSGPTATARAWAVRRYDGCAASMPALPATPEVYRSNYLFAAGTKITASAKPDDADRARDSNSAATAPTASRRTHGQSQCFECVSHQSIDGCDANSLVAICRCTRSNSVR